MLCMKRLVIVGRMCFIGCAPPSRFLICVWIPLLAPVAAGRPAATGP